MKDKETQIQEISEGILEDYMWDRSINENHPTDQIEWHAVISALLKIQNVLIPGPGHMTYSLDDMKQIIRSIVDTLSKQIAIVLRYLPEYADAPQDERLEMGEKKTMDLMWRIPKIREYLEMDLQAAFEGDPAAYNKDEILYSYPGLHAIMIYRIAHELYKMNIPILPRILTEYGHNLTGIDIHPGATIGRYFFIDHGTGIVIGETTVIGNNVKIYQGVTLGALSTRGGQQLKNVKRHPTIEDNVTIYSGASILGGKTVIGENVVIGGNAFITHSIPANTKVSIKTQELHIVPGTPEPVSKTDKPEDSPDSF